MQPVSRFLASFRWLFMPLGLLALVAMGVHAAADIVDDRVLRAVESLDAWLDSLLAAHDATAAWVNRIDSPQRTLIARGVALTWELLVDFFVALPMLGYDEVAEAETRTFALIRKETWKDLFSRVNRQPTPMRLVRPVVTLLFTLGGAMAVARLVEATAFVSLLDTKLATADISALVARLVGGLAMAVLLASPCWRAVLRALQHADAACTKSPRPWLEGLRGTVLSLPLALALVLEAESFLSFFR